MSEAFSKKKHQEPAAPIVFETDSGQKAFASKLRRFLQALDQVDTLRRKKRRRRGLLLLPAALLLIFLWVMAFIAGHPIVIVFFMGAVLIGAIAVTDLKASFTRHDELARAKQVQAFFERLRQDLHPHTKVKCRVDLGEATAQIPERSGNSPYSGASKLWFRHPWLTLRWAFADGNHLSLTLIDLVKTKSGTEIRREHRVKGHLRVNPAIYGEARDLQLRRLQFTSQQGEHGTDLWFWGTLKSHDELLVELQALYSCLTSHQGARQTA